MGIAAVSHDVTWTAAELPFLAIGESSVILLTRSLSVAVETPAKGRGDCSRMTELSPAARLDVAAEVDAHCMVLADMDYPHH